MGRGTWQGTEIRRNNRTQRRGTLSNRRRAGIEEIIEQTIEQTIEQPTEQIEWTTRKMLGAVDNYFNFLQGTISSYPSGGTDSGENLKCYAQQNIAATHEFVQKIESSWGFLRSRSYPDRI